MVTSHQKPKVAYHVVGKRNKSSSHLVKLNKSDFISGQCAKIVFTWKRHASGDEVGEENYVYRSVTPTKRQKTTKRFSKRSSFRSIVAMKTVPTPRPSACSA